MQFRLSTLLLLVAVIAASTAITLHLKQKRRHWSSSVEEFLGKSSEFEKHKIRGIFGDSKGPFYCSHKTILPGGGISRKWTFSENGVLRTINLDLEQNDLLIIQLTNAFENGVVIVLDPSMP